MTATRKIPVSMPPCRSPFYNDLGGEGDYYYNARWYDAQTGRFITEDPARDGQNWYSYVTNNPLKYIDPTGMSRVDGDDVDDARDDQQREIDEVDREIREADSLEEAEALYKDKLDLQGDLPVDFDALYQTDNILNELAQLNGNFGLENPGRWACAYLASNYQIFSELNAAPTRNELINFANSMNGELSRIYGDQVVGNEYKVGDFYHLLSSGVSSTTPNKQAAPAKVSNTGFTILKYQTNSGFHFKAADSLGNETYDPDPNVNTIGEPEIYRFRWKINE